MKRVPLVLGIAIIVITNGLALISVAHNRTGEPVQTIELTERELPLQNLGQDNSGVDLRFAWTRQGSTFVDPALNRAKLEAIGFDFHIDTDAPAEYFFSLLPRIAYVAFEYEGKAWEQWLQWAENEKQPALTPIRGPIAAPNFERDRVSKSRLCVVDASMDISDLRRRFPDQSKYLIVRAIITARLDPIKDPQTGVTTARNCSGFVAELVPGTIHVPLPEARLLSSLKPQTSPAPRYAVTLRYGRNLEPWVASVRLLSNAANK
jgi:hypothetical protein